MEMRVRRRESSRHFPNMQKADIPWNMSGIDRSRNSIRHAYFFSAQTELLIESGGLNSDSMAALALGSVCFLTCEC